MRVEVETTEYEKTHGRAPRGRGSWAFTFDTPTYQDVAEVWFTPGGTTWQEAKKQAIAEARKRGASYVSAQA